MLQEVARIPFPFFGYHYIPVFGYGLALFVAFLAAMNLAAWRARREKINPEVLYDLALWVFIGGLVGARLFFVWQYWGTKVRSVREIFMIQQGGIVLYGSIMGGTAAFFLYWWLRRFPLRPVLDTVAPSLALGIAIGRVGCLLNGCCYGDTCDLPWAVHFPPDSPPWWDQVRDRQLEVTPAVQKSIQEGTLPPGTPWSLGVHPTQIYSTIDGLILLGLLSSYYPLRRRDGEVMGLLMVTYPVTRFLIERLRNDEGAFFAGMTISQNLSVLLLLGGVGYWVCLSRLPLGRYADTAPDRAEAEAVA